MSNFAIFMFVTGVGTFTATMLAAAASGYQTILGGGIVLAGLTLVGFGVGSLLGLIK